MIATKYFNYQTYGKQRFTTNSPNTIATMNYLIKRWGGMNLGCTVNVRSVRHGTAISTHASGMALDYRWENPDPDTDRRLYPGRKVLDEQILPWLINNSAERGYQLIVDYAKDRAWNASRSGDAFGGWKAGNYNGGGWLHIEIHPDFHGLDTPIESTPVPPPVKEDLMVWILAPQGCYARFVMLGTSHGVGTTCRWLKNNTETQAFIAAGAQTLPCKPENLNNLWLEGPLPTGDPGRQWSNADFANA